VTQLALLTSLMALSRTLIGAPAGWLFLQVGWSNYFLIALFLAIPSFIFLARLDRWLRTSEAMAKAK
jgi:PAT family beta-lactamase induction signal transducer AmpG